MFRLYSVIYLGIKNSGNFIIFLYGFMLYSKLREGLDSVFNIFEERICVFLS